MLSQSPKSAKRGQRARSELTDCPRQADESNSTSDAHFAEMPDNLDLIPQAAAAQLPNVQHPPIPVACHVSPFLKHPDFESPFCNQLNLRLNNQDGVVPAGLGLREDKWLDGVWNAEAEGAVSRAGHGLDWMGFRFKSQDQLALRG